MVGTKRYARFPIGRALKHFLLLFLSIGSLSLAQPSVFPESALHVSAGYRGDIGASLGFEYFLSQVNYLDASADLMLLADVAGDFGVRLSGTALVFPAVGIGLPLAVGVGSDIGFVDGAVSLHAGFIVGSDLLIVTDLPMTISAYLAPGYAGNAGFSFAWAFQLRYYFDRFAVELASSDLLPVSLGVRYLF